MRNILHAHRWCWAWNTKSRAPAGGLWWTSAPTTDTDEQCSPSSSQIKPRPPPSAHRDRASIPTRCSELCGSPITSCVLPDNRGCHFLVLKIFTSTRAPRQSAPAVCLQCKWRTFLLPSSFNCSRSHPRNGKRNSVTTENEVFFFLSFEGANESQGDIYQIIKGNTDECSSCNFSFQSQNPF